MTARAVRAAVLALAVMLVGAACGSPRALPAGAAAGTGSPSAAPAAAGATEPGARRAVSLVTGALVVRGGPSVSDRVLTRLPARTPLGSARVLLVDRVTPGWVHVALPVRPNGSSGWVAATDVRVEPVHDLVTVDLSARTLTLTLGGVEVTRTRVAVGSAADPTPVGTFYVTDRVRPPDQNGAYGAFALGLSAHSDTLSEFGSGDGQIGIHGTDQPSSIGRAVSHGCIRVPLQVAELLPRVPLGTPVVIS